MPVWCTRHDVGRLGLADEGHRNGVFQRSACFPRNQAHGDGGQIVTTSSISGMVPLDPGAAANVVSKFRVVGLVEVLRPELEDTNIGASVFCPGMVPCNIEQSSRNRPANLADKRLKGPPHPPDTGNSAPPSPDLSTIAHVGQVALRGIRNNVFYIPSHPSSVSQDLRHNALLRL